MSEETLRTKNPHAPLPGSTIPVDKLPPDINPIEDSRTKAARRTQELIGLYGDNIGEGDDKFWIDPQIIPDGWTYEWKRYTVLGAQYPQYQIELARGGWEAVPAERHRQLVPTSWTGHSIEREGLILMERPMQIQQMVNDREKRKAGQLVQAKEAQLKGGPETAFDPSKKASYVRKSLEPMSVPKS